MSEQYRMLKHSLRACLNSYFYTKNSKKYLFWHFFIKNTQKGLFFVAASGGNSFTCLVVVHVYFFLVSPPQNVFLATPLHIITRILLQTTWRRDSMGIASSFPSRPNSRRMRTSAEGCPRLTQRSLEWSAHLGSSNSTKFLVNLDGWKCNNK